MVQLTAFLIPFSMIFGQEGGGPSQVLDFTSLGVAGLICMVLGYAWIRTEKRLDTANELNAQMLPVLTNVQSTLLRNIESNEKTVDILKEVASVIQRVPGAETWTRVIVSLENNERRKGS